MNTQKSVFNKISKIEREVESKEVELSEVQKVELGSIDNARKIVSSITEEEKEFVKIAKEIDSLKSKAQNKIQILRNLSGNLKDAATRIQKAEQELGEGEMGDYFLDLQRDIENVIKSTISKYDI